MDYNQEIKKSKLKRTVKIMKIAVFFLTSCLSSMMAISSYAQSTKLNVRAEKSTLESVLKQIEKQSEYLFFYNASEINKNKTVSVTKKDATIQEVMDIIASEASIRYTVKDRHVVLNKGEATSALTLQKGIKITGKIVDPNGETIIGANVIEKGTTNGTITDIDGNFTLAVPKKAILIISYIGYSDQELAVSGKSTFNITLKENSEVLDEVIVVGYGSMKKSDLTGSVVRADLESFKESGNLSILQSLQGSIPGLEIDATTQAGQEAEMSVRGQSSLSGESSPLIVVDGVIYRGKLIDINPADIASVDILKDASSAAIYGSQAANGVIIITTTRGEGIDGKPTINFTSSYSFQNGAKELYPSSLEAFDYKTEIASLFTSRTKESGYMERNPNWQVTEQFASAQEIDAYNAGKTTDWYDLLTNDNMHSQNHNVSIANSTKHASYLMSLGYSEQAGYMENDDYSRINARINIDNKITDWFSVGAQTFFSSSDYSGTTPSALGRYTSPYYTSHDDDGVLYPIVRTDMINPLLQLEADDYDKRLNFFGNIYAEIKIPYIKGLSYKVNYANNYTSNSQYYFRDYGGSFLGEGSKKEIRNYDWSVDNIVSYKKKFNDVHNFDATLVYGVEKRSSSTTHALASDFASMALGYNRLQAGNSALQKASSEAWEEASLYTMGRLFYSYNGKYLVTGTIRRDGFSGFSKNNKFAIFPSVSMAWMFSEESFMKDFNWLDNAKLRASYGSVGNRTIGRYQTLATINGGFNFIDANGDSQYTQRINGLASPNLQWETTTGVNIGFDFGFLGRLSGNIEYYNNKTTNLLYNVDIPSITSYNKFPDNLGELNNFGLEIGLTSYNIKKKNWEWTTTLNFARNRNKLVSLLGQDNDGDGKEDDLVSAGLFIGESIDAVFDYEIDGMWQVGEDATEHGYSYGTYKVVDQNGDGKITTDDKKILGSKAPAYTLGIGNNIRFKNWNLYFFINSIQGGKNSYIAPEMYDFYLSGIVHYKVIFPENIDFWAPENPNAKYERADKLAPDGSAGNLYSQRNFIRLQDLSLSYSVPKKILSKLKIQNLKLFVSGKNLLTLTKWDGWDPETGVSMTPSGLPITKSYTVGIDLKF